ncbi:MAG: hypothetical protein AAFY56_16635 [Pseudomonadota bacterium]
MTKIIFVVFALLTAGAAYATYYGYGAESNNVSRSVRAGSVGNAVAYGVK